MQAPSFYQQLKVLLALEVISFCFLGHFGLLLCTELRFVVSIYKFKYVNSLLSLLNPIFKKKNKSTRAGKMAWQVKMLTMPTRWSEFDLWNPRWKERINYWKLSSANCSHVGCGTCPPCSHTSHTGMHAHNYYYLLVNEFTGVLVMSLCCPHF